jgi:hypothetical protein
MKKIMIVLFTVVAVGGFQVLYAQEADQNIGETPDKKEFTEPVRNVVYLELGGAGIMYSLNYERRFTEKLWGRAGLSYFFLFGSAHISTQYLWGDGPWHFETGLGITAGYVDTIFSLENEDDRLSAVLYNATIGLRYQKKEQNIFFKAGFTPLVTFNFRRAVPYGGLSFGVTF